MKLQITYHIAGTNSVYTPVDCIIKSMIDTALSNSLPFNTTCALNNFVPAEDIMGIIIELDNMIKTKKFNRSSTRLFTKNIGMYIITVSAKLI